jgi:hypothetical protein
MVILNALIKITKEISILAQNVIFSVTMDLNLKEPAKHHVIEKDFGQADKFQNVFK